MNYPESSTILPLINSTAWYNEAQLDGCFFFFARELSARSLLKILDTYIHELYMSRTCKQKYLYYESFVSGHFWRGEGIGEERLVFVSKSIPVFTHDPWTTYF